MYIRPSWLNRTYSTYYTIWYDNGFSFLLWRFYTYSIIHTLARSRISSSELVMNSGHDMRDAYNTYDRSRVLATRCMRTCVRIVPQAMGYFVYSCGWSFFFFSPSYSYCSRGVCLLSRFLFVFVFSSLFCLNKYFYLFQSTSVAGVTLMSSLFYCVTMQCPCVVFMWELVLY